MRKKITALLIFLTATLIPVFASVQIGDLYYNLNSNSLTAEVTCQADRSTNNYSGLTTTVIPDSITYNDSVYCVTSIGDYAFCRCSSITSVDIPNSVTSIKEGAFYECSGLTSMDIPNSVTSIGDGAFSGCYNLMSVSIPNSVTRIGIWFFQNCSSLTSIDIPNSVTSIGDYAFYQSGLTSVSIPNSVSYIGKEAFECCSNLQSVTIGNNVTSIGTRAFFKCSSLMNVVVENGNTVYDSRDSCNAIIKTATNALSIGCKNSVIPNSVTSIEYEAFRGCSGLTSIIIPNSVTNIGECAFCECNSLTSVTIPNSVTSIGGAAFSSCSGLKSVTIGNSVSSIGEAAFYGCSGLTSINIPNSVISIGNEAFCFCSSLKSVAIPHSVRKMGDSIFGFCSALKSVTIENGVTSIGKRAFYGCSGITTITCEAATPPMCDTLVFQNVPTFYCTLYVPAASMAAYQVANTWRDFTHIQAIAETCEEIISEEQATACATEGYMWHKNTYTQGGTYYDTLKSIIGCDSVCILHLSIQSATDELIIDTVVCEGDLPVIWHGMSLSKAGIYYDAVPYSATGCDSIRYTLNLTVNVPTYVEEIVSVCEDNLPYDWRGGASWNQVIISTRYIIGVYGAIVFAITCTSPSPNCPSIPLMSWLTTDMSTARVPIPKARISH